MDKESPKKLLRFKELKAAGIVTDRATLRRWVNKYGFPQGTCLGPNIVAWNSAEIDQWLESRPKGKARQVA